MIIGPNLKKQSGEVIPWPVNWTTILVDSETIDDVEFRVVTQPGNDDVTEDIQSGAPDINGAVVTQLLMGGEHGTDYMLEMRIITSLGRKWEAERRLVVRDIPAPA